MHTAVQIFDFSAKGNFGNIDKVAIKLSGKNEALNSQTASDFLKIMGAAMHLDPEQVQASLDQFERIPIEGETAGGFAPLIDLSGEGDEPEDMIAMLMGKAAGRHDSPEAEGEDGDGDDDHCPSCADMAGMIPAPVNEVAAAAVQTVATESESNPSERAARGAGSQPVQAPDPHMLKAAASAAIEGTPDMTKDVRKPDPAGKPPVQVQVQAPGNTGAAKPAVATPEMQPAVADLNTKSPSNAPATPGMNATTAQGPATAADTPATTNAGQVDTTLQATVANETVKAARLVRKAAPATATEKPSISVAPVEAGDRQTGAVAPKFAMGDQVKVAADTAKSAEPALDTGGDESLPGGIAKEGDTAQRPPADREGFQSAMSRLHTHGHKSAGHVSAEKVMPEPSKEMQNDVMRQIVQRMTLRTQGTQSKMQIQLKPEFLGNVHMQISTENHQVAVRMTAESVVVKEMIEQHLAFLKSELQQHGLEIDKFDVQVGGDREGWKNSQDPSGFRQALKEGQKGRMGRQKREPSDDDQQDASKEAAPVDRRHSNEIDYFA